MKEDKTNIRGQIETIIWELMKSKTDINIVLKDSDDIDSIGYPRIEFEVIEINLNQDNMSISNEYDMEDLNIVDNYNRTCRYMIDFVLIHTPENEVNIDELIKYLTNYWKMDKYFYNFDYSKYDIEDITIIQDFKPSNRNMFYLDQAIKRDGYSFTLDVDIVDKDIIPMGAYMKRGEFND